MNDGSNAPRQSLIVFEATKPSNPSGCVLGPLTINPVTGTIRQVAIG